MSAALPVRLVLVAAAVCASAVVGDVVAAPQARAAGQVPIIETVAGNGKGTGCSGDGGPATDAAMNTPQAVAVAANGNTYIADAGNNVIRMIAASTGTFFGQPMTAGDIYTVVGRGNGPYSPCSPPGYQGDGGPAAGAQLNSPAGLAVGPDGSLYIVDLNNFAIRMVPATSGTFFGQPMVAGDIYTVAGDGVEGYSGDGGPATSAHLGLSETLAVRADGSLDIADFTCNCVREVTPTGTIVTFASGFDTPLGIGLDAAGNLYVAAVGANRIFKVAADGSTSPYAGTGVRGYSGDGGAATSAQLDTPHGLAVSADGSVYFSDRANSRIRVISPQGVISTYAGDGTSGFSGDGGPATDAEVNYVEAVAVGPHGDVYIADSLNNRIREIAVPVTSTPTGLTVTPGNGSLTLSWTPNPAADGVTHYRVYRADQQSSAAWASLTGTTFTDTIDVVNGTQYCYQVSAGNDSGEGARTPAMCATPTKPPVPIQPPVASPSPTQPPATVVLSTQSSLPPAPVITGHPATVSTQTTATFSFADAQAGVRFTCSVDGGPFSDCSSPRRYDGLGDGQHIFRVHVLDSLGRASGDASFTWSVNGAVKGAKTNYAMNIRNIRGWVRLAVIDEFYGGRGATKLTAFRVSTCAKRHSGRFRCRVSWRRAPNAFAGTVTIGGLNRRTGQFRSGFSLIRRNTLTGATRRISVPY